MREQVKEILSEVLDIDLTSIPDDASMAAIQGWDSLNHMRILKRLEETFDFKLTIRSIQRTLSISQILEELNNHKSS